MALDIMFPNDEAILSFLEMTQALHNEERPNDTYNRERQKKMEEALKHVQIAAELTASITSRSSWARYGVSTWNAITAFDPDHLVQNRESDLLFNLKTFNTTVILRPGNAPAQIRCAKQGFINLFDNQIVQIPDYGKIV